MLRFCDGGRQEQLEKVKISVYWRTTVIWRAFTGEVVHSLHVVDEGGIRLDEVGKAKQMKW